MKNHWTCRWVHLTSICRQMKPKRNNGGISLGLWKRIHQLWWVWYKQNQNLIKKLEISGSLWWKAHKAKINGALLKVRSAQHPKVSEYNNSLLYTNKGCLERNVALLDHLPQWKNTSGSLSERARICLKVWIKSFDFYNILLPWAQMDIKAGIWIQNLHQKVSVRERCRHPGSQLRHPLFKCTVVAVVLKLVQFSTMLIHVTLVGRFKQLLVKFLQGYKIP